MMPEEWPIAVPAADGNASARLAGRGRLSTVRRDFFLDPAKRLTEQERALMTQPVVATPVVARLERPGGAVADNAGIAPVAALCLPRWPARHGWPGDGASVVLRCDRRPSSNGSEDEWADRNARNP